MRSFLISTSIGCAWFTTMLAQEPTVVESVEIVDYGIYRIELTGQHVPMPSTGSGAVQPASRAVLIAKTNSIPATLGTTFGCQFVVNGKPTSALAQVEIVVEHPAFQRPGAKVISTSDRITWQYRIGDKVGYTYTFDHDWEAVPGKWSIEVWRRGIKLLSKEFLVRPVGK